MPKITDSQVDQCKIAINSCASVMRFASNDTIRNAIASVVLTITGHTIDEIEKAFATPPVSKDTPTTKKGA